MPKRYKDKKLCQSRKSNQVRGCNSSVRILLLCTDEMSVYSVKGTSFPDRQIFFVFHSQAEKLFLSQPTDLNQEMKVISSIHARQLLAYTCTAALCLFKYYTNKPSLLTLYRQGHGHGRLTRLKGANSSSALADGHTSGCCRENLFLTLL